MKPPLIRAALVDFLDQYAGPKVPGLQYMVIDTDENSFRICRRLGGYSSSKANDP